MKDEVIQVGVQGDPWTPLACSSGMITDLESTKNSLFATGFQIVQCVLANGGGTKECTPYLKWLRLTSIS